MKIEIAKTDKYILAVDAAKNRIYYAMIGFWQKESDVPNYLQDWEKALAKVKTGFTVLTDITRCKTPQPSLKPMFEKMQKRLGEAGLKKTAELYPEDALIELSLAGIAKRSGMKKGNFKERQKAEAWLDEA